MKKRTAKRQPEPEPIIRDDRASQENVLAVLVDSDNGHEYYMSFIDAFQLNGREYIVFYPYEPDDGYHADPELTILRSVRQEHGEQYFLSIKNRKELEAAFNHFFKRLEASGNVS
jgi:hypothetical protein